MKFRLLLLTGVLIFLSAASTVSADEAKQVAPTPVQVVPYTLPHPGLLPGHMFYSLKTMRDDIKGFLISGPLKKAEFNLLLADKYVQTSYLLVMGEKKDVAAAAQAFAKGEAYFEEAVRKTDDAKKQGLDTADITKRLTLANLKYREIMQVIEKGATATEKELFKEEKAELEELAKSVKHIVK